MSKYCFQSNINTRVVLVLKRKVLMILHCDKPFANSWANPQIAGPDRHPNMGRSSSG